MHPQVTTSTFTSSRGAELSARLELPRGPVRASVLFAHCFTCSKDLRVERQLTAALARRGLAVLSFDFAGIGRSAGRPGFGADVADVRAAAEHLARAVAPPVLLVGHSLGGAAVLSAAPSLPSVRAVATIGAPADPAHVAKLLEGDLDAIRREGAGSVRVGGHAVEITRSFLDELATDPPTDRLSAYRGAVLLLHAPRDEVVGIENAELLYRAARHPKSFVTLDDADHLLTEPSDADYAASVIGSWAERYLPPAPDVDQPAYAQEGATAVNSDGARTDVDARGFAMVLDEPHAVGGSQQGATPYDHLAVALAGCTVMTMRMYAERKGWDVGEIRAHVSHGRRYVDDCRDSGRIDVFSRELELPAGLSRAQRDALTRIADRCPVHRTLEATARVVTTVRD